MVDYNFLSYLLVGAIAVLLLALISHYINLLVYRKKQIFMKRFEVYLPILGHIVNLFLDREIQQFPDPIKVSEINKILAKTYLVGSKDLIKLIEEFQEKIHEFHSQLDAENQSANKAESLHRHLTELANKIHIQMRKDLYIDNRF